MFFLKYYFVAFIALCAIGTKPSYLPFSCSSSNLIWYDVMPGNGNSFIGSFGSGVAIGITNRALLDLSLYNDMGSPTPDNTVTFSADFLNAGRLQSVDQINFRCGLAGTPKCAIAFVVDSTPDGEFEIDGLGNIIPKATAIVACFLTRPEP